MTYDEHVDCDNQLNEAEDKITKLQVENKNWKARYIEAVNDMAALTRKITKLEQALKG